MMIKFRSLNVLDTFTEGNLSVNIRASMLQSGNDTYDDIVDSLEEIVDLVNSEDGWTVYGWGKRGQINVVSLLGNDIKEPGDNKVPSQDISTHVLHLHPYKEYYLELSTIQRNSPDNLKCDFYTL